MFVGNQREVTKTIMPPLNFAPVWKEVLPFDITSPFDKVKIKINNMAETPENRQLAEKTFVVGPSNRAENEEEDVTYKLKEQRPIDDMIVIERSDNGA